MCRYVSADWTRGDGSNAGKDSKCHAEEGKILIISQYDFQEANWKEGWLFKKSGRGISNSWKKIQSKFCFYKHPD